MSQDLEKLTDAELKEYLSAHKNEDKAFSAAL